MSVKLKNFEKPRPSGRITKASNSIPVKDRQNNGSDEDSFSESDEDDEEEDEEGDLITEKIDSGINDVLKALRSNDSNLKDKKFQFFPEIGAEGTREAEVPVKKEKPMYLKDYQREQLLSKQRNTKQEEVQEPTYNEQQEALKNDFIKQFHDNEDEDEDDMLLTKREGPSREIPEIELPNPDNDADGFLDAFINGKGWLPKSKAEDNVPTYKEVAEDEDSDEFDDLSEKFESAYNFRFEDPEAAEIVSYARDQSTLRRGKLSSRQKKREKEREARDKELQKEKLEKAKLKKSKVNEITDKLAQLQEALGEGDERVAELLANEDLDGDWDNDEWDKRMQKLFDEEYYDKESDEKIGNVEDLGEEVKNNDVKFENMDSGDEASSNNDMKLNIKEGTRLSRKQLKRKAEQFVDSNQDLIDEAFLPTKSNFRYREVEAESFGLTSRDILLASDKDLNQFVGIKKLASYRDKSRMDADRRHYSKSKRLRKWREEVFGNEAPPSDEAWEKAKAEVQSEEPIKQKKHKNHKEHKGHKKHKKN